MGSRSASTRRPRAAGDVRRYRTRAEGALRRFRRGTVLAVGLTGLLLMLWGGDAAAGDAAPDAPVAQETAGEAPPQEGPAAAGDTVIADSLEADDTAEADPGRSVEEATGTLRGLARDAYGILPKILIALALLVVTALLVKLARAALRRLFGGWERADAAAALVSVLLWLLALGTALSVLVGDVRALVGSIGLAGLALSWALQAPIESFTGWLLNSFRGYYRPGDRILVGEVFGDVHRIDVLTTTVWESGGPDKPVQGAQPTGAMVTFPNSEVLRANIVNYTRDFPYVWDELTVALAPETDLRFAMDTVREVADRIVGDAMAGAGERYAAVVRGKDLDDEEVAIRPEVYISPSDSWTDLTVRYLVPARERRKWSTRLLLAIDEAIQSPETEGRIVPGLPRQVVEETRGRPGPPPGPPPRRP